MQIRPDAGLTNVRSSAANFRVRHSSTTAPAGAGIPTLFEFITPLPEISSDSFKKGIDVFSNSWKLNVTNWKTFEFFLGLIASRIYQAVASITDGAPK